jgi:hypothetical protein
MALLKCRVLSLVVATVLVPMAAFAQTRTAGVTAPSNPRLWRVNFDRQATGNRLLTARVLPALESAAVRPNDWSSASRPAPGTKKRTSLGLAIGIGIGGSVGVAALAASRYGRNEGGGFCASCFAQWSAISIPIGAGVGAAVGYLIDRARR